MAGRSSRPGVALQLPPGPGRSERDDLQTRISRTLGVLARHMGGPVAALAERLKPVSTLQVTAASIAAALPHARCLLPVQEATPAGTPAALALLAGPAATNPALLVTPGPGHDPGWTLGLAWLDCLALEAAPEEQALVRAALTAWLAADRWPPEAASRPDVAICVAQALVRLAPLLAQHSTWFGNGSEEHLARRLAQTITAIDRARLDKRALRSDQVIDLLIGLCAVTTALPLVVPPETQARLWSDLATSLAGLLDHGSATPAQLQGWTASITMLAEASAPEALASIAPIAPRLTYALRLLTKADTDLCCFGGGPGVPALNAAFAAAAVSEPGTDDRGPAPHPMAPTVSRERGFSGCAAGYGRIETAGVRLWLGLPQGCHPLAALEIETDDGLILSTDLHRSARPGYQLARLAGRSAASLSSNALASKTAPHSPALHVRIRDGADGLQLEALARPGSEQSLHARRIILARDGSRIDGFESIPCNATDEITGCQLRFFASRRVRACASIDSKSVLFVTHCGTAWRLRAKGLDFQTANGLSAGAQRKSTAFSSILGKGGVVGFKGLVELHWSLVRES